MGIIHFKAKHYSLALTLAFVAVFSVWARGTDSRQGVTITQEPAARESPAHEPQRWPDHSRPRGINEIHGIPITQEIEAPPPIPHHPARTAIPALPPLPAEPKPLPAPPIDTISTALDTVVIPPPVADTMPVVPATITPDTTEAKGVKKPAKRMMANAPISAEARAEVERRLIGASRPTVLGLVDEHMVSHLPHHKQLIDATMRELATIAKEFMAEFSDDSGS